MLAGTISAPKVLVAMSDSLQEALFTAPAPARLPAPLPLGHLSIWRWLDSILQAGMLHPRHCTVFGRNWLYFSYGGVFYRMTDRPTQQASELPVGFVFSPSVLGIIAEYFPFDSGAMAGGRFGPWCTRMDPFPERFRVTAGKPSDPAGLLESAPRLVYEVYGTNRAYLRGMPDAAASTKPPPFPLLASFLQDDLSSIGVDRRQRSIEGLVANPVTLEKDLLWVGIPNIAVDRVTDAIYRLTRPLMPKIFSYDEQPLNFHPREVAKVLEDQAFRDVISRYVDR
jgi:hypothetical protein